jgi:prepilin-type N-terminal cleavage/methylation domain-containing protein
MNGDNTGLKEKQINHKSNASLKGFTLVELIVVLVILAIIAAVAIPAMLGYTDSAKEKQYTSDAEAAKNAAQATLTDIYNDASNQLTPSKRTDIASIAGLDAQNSQFKIWTAQKLVDGVTPCTIDHIGSFTIQYALYRTVNDESDNSGKYVFFDGKKWTICNDKEDLDIAMAKVNATEQDDTIIHLWPNSTNGTQYADDAYNPNQGGEENWDPDEEDNKETYVIKLRNYNSAQGKNEPGVLFKLGNLESNLPDTLSVEFEQDAAAGIVSKNWTEANRVE